MANALNVRLINNVTSIAQGDNASTVILELLDNNRLIMPFLNGKTSLINFISDRNEIQYQTTAPVFDSRIEFNVDVVLPHGRYNVEVRIEDEDASYVFPSSDNYMLTIHKSANDFYNVAVEVNGVEVIVHEVYQRLEAENPGLLEHVDRRDNPHGTTKSQVGLGNVDNIKQASKQEFDEHAEDSSIHVTQAEKQSWDSKATQEDIDDAVEGLDFVTIPSFTGHVGNEETHWKEGEKSETMDLLNLVNQVLESHVEDEGNPHGVTSEQINVVRLEDTELPTIDNVNNGITLYDRYNYISDLVIKENNLMYSLRYYNGLDNLRFVRYDNTSDSWPDNPSDDDEIVLRKDLGNTIYVSVATVDPSRFNTSESLAFLRDGILHVKLNVLFRQEDTSLFDFARVLMVTSDRVDGFLGNELYFNGVITNSEGKAQMCVIRAYKDENNDKRVIFNCHHSDGIAVGDVLDATISIPLTYSN